ncbi:SWI/SNF and RSC complexes subunit ssr3 [Fusarium oxysporum f. sp. albedinis]|nr:SWI/SNF and RSC complexes subunit ssr3 [Fusarium oxysporum f. sp. albedinis]
MGVGRSFHSWNGQFSSSTLLRPLNFHYSCAGNDAHLTLRVLLMIAVRDAEIHLSGKRLPDWIPIFKVVAQSPLPPRPPTKREIAAMAEAEAEQQTAIEAKEV